MSDRLVIWSSTDNIAITADAQLLINPALNPGEDQIAVFGVRTRFNI